MTKSISAWCPTRCITTSNFNSSKQFYCKVLNTLNIQAVVEETDALGFGQGSPYFWLRRVEQRSAKTDTSLYFQASSEEEVINFFATVFEEGGHCVSEPAYLDNSYSCKVKDPEGNVLTVNYPETDKK